ncbi:hypothetical protein FS749_003397 [Ceratobasidium sp. UAMH 11750]|nr:hypothetical protein FS749_003397 [Ceratobasidium sp. UAMH 11750]
MARAFLTHQRSKEVQDMRKRNSLFIFRCGLSLNREMEFSSQQAIAYFMGLGDVIQSHTYSTIYLSSVVSALKAIYPELKAGGADLEQASSSSVDNSDGLRIGVSQTGSLYLRSQLDDYRYRADQLEGENFLDYFVNTYEERIRKKAIDEPDEELEVNASTRGRPQNPRAPYQPAHPRTQTHQRVVRSNGHRNLPDVVGPWFARRDDPEVYALHCASALALLKPWRDLAELKAGCSTWGDVLNTFLGATSRRRQSIWANMQYYYQCQDSAGQARSDEEAMEGQTEEPTNELDLRDFVNGVELDQVVLSRRKQKELDHAERAAAIGLKFGLFGKAGGGEDWEIREVDDNVTHDAEKVKQWTDALRLAAAEQKQGSPLQHFDAAENPEDLGNINAITEDLGHAPSTVGEGSISYQGDPTPPQTELDVSMLTDEQLLVVNVVKGHVLENLAGKQPDQLLMHIQGEGGTGKSLVISELTELFRTLGKESKLRKSAYTGIAACLIGGATLHQLAKLHMCGNGKTLSKKTIEQL